MKKPIKQKLTKKDLKKIDLQSQDQEAGWVYSEKVKEHFFHPKNLMVKDDPKFKFNALGVFGSPACGDVMKVWLLVDPKSERIKECRWRTFGCASAIATTSVMSEMVKNMKLDDALQITPADILKELGGLPLRKVHCSVLGDKALREAIYDYYQRTGQKDKIKKESARTIDKDSGLTDKDIEQAVLDGARAFEDIQARIKTRIREVKTRTDIEQLLRFYKEKHYGKEK